MSRQQIDFPVQQHHIATPPPPPAGSLKLYPKADNVLYKLTSAGVESAVGVIPDPLVVNNATVNQVLTVGQRIKGDFSNATNSSRTLFQTSVVNGAAYVGIMPDGSGSETRLYLYGSSGVNNTTSLSMGVGGGVTVLDSNKHGVGGYQPLVFRAYGQERGRMDDIATNWQAPADVRINSNVYYDGAAWTRFDTVNALSHINVGRGTFNYYNAVAGTGAPAWVARLTISAAGAVAVGALSTAAISASGDVNGYYLGTSDGNNGIVRSNAGSLYVRGSNGHVYVDGAGGLHVSGGPLDVATGMTLTNGKLDLYKASTPVGYSTTNIEVRAPTPNAPGIGFHESGSTATTLYKRPGTEELWQRYNSGSVDARLLHNGEVSEAASGSTLVRRNASGYIYANYVNLTADVSGSAPAYVAGQNGDGFLRWYPKSLVGPPALNWAQLTQSCAAAGGGAWTNCTFAGSGNAYVRNDSSQMTILKAGYFSIFAAGGGYYAVGVRISVGGTIVASQTGNSNDFAVCGTGWTGFCNSWVQVHRYGGVAQGAATFHMTWVPTDAYP